MNTFAQIISLWPTISALADDIGVQYVTAQAMARRERIPSRYWNALVAGAQRRGFVGVTLEVLADISESTAKPMKPCNGHVGNGMAA